MAARQQTISGELTTGSLCILAQVSLISKWLVLTLNPNVFIGLFNGTISVTNMDYYN